MSRPRPAILIPLLVLALGCSDDSAGTSAAPTPGDDRPETITVTSVVESGEHDPRRIIPDRDEDEVWGEVERFYRQRGMVAAWLTSDGPRAAADEAIDAISDASSHGLEPSAYRVDDLERRLRAAALADGANADALARLDVDMTTALITYGTHLMRGRVQPSAINTTWRTTPRTISRASLLDWALSKGSIADMISSLAPQHPEYAQLQEILERYRRIADGGDWPEVPEGTVLEPGDDGSPERLGALRARLEAEGYDVPAAAEDTEGTFSDSLSTALERFQDEHGLTVDGALGPNTVAALNVSAAARVHQIELNMERWRWLPKKLGPVHVRVNLPAFDLRVYQNDTVTMEMKVIVGKRGWSTPVFHDQIEYIVINPYWNVPDSIVQSEILPKLEDNPYYLTENNFEVVEGWGDDEKTIPPASIDWESVDLDELPYRLRQKPGWNNPLGQLKFMFPNDFNIYLHDTPADSLFNADDRNLRHGCIRLERPVDLANFLLRNDPDWSPSRLRAALDSGENQSVRLPEPVPVFIGYWTVGRGPDGRVHFYEDIYDVDSQLDDALAHVGSASG